MKEKFEDEIIDSWKNNVNPWITAIRDGEIESRFLVTNKAVVNAILNRKPKTVLDVGCGEGWLVRELAKTRISCMGTDIVPKLIEHAKKVGGGRFKTIPYENLSHNLLPKKFDLIVCNFSLLGNESVIDLFQQIPALLNKGGLFIVQTIHPISGCGEEKYIDGWRKGSWKGFSAEFSKPAPWYFRTLETWKILFQENGFKLREVLEPLNPKTKVPASVIFIGQLASRLSIQKKVLL